MKSGLDTKLYRLVMAAEDFRWRGKRAPGLPILCERDGSVCEPVSYYLGWSHWRARVRISSLQKQAYVLREWWTYLHSVGCAWDQVTDRTLSDWRESMKEGSQGRRVEISAQRIFDKCQVVFAFYDKVPAAMHLARKFVSQNGPITESELPVLSLQGPRVRWNPRKRWALHEGTERNTIRRGTPDESLAKKVLTQLRNSAKHDSRQPWKAEETNDRRWLLGRIMAEAGLRREEAARLTVGMIADAIKAAGIQSVECSPLEAEKLLTDLDAVVAQQSQDAILRALERHLLKEHRSNIWVIVKGKGRVIREVPFPIELIRDLLIFGVWGVRRSQIVRWAAETKSYRPPPQIFLSDKTRRGLSAGAVGNLMKVAFAACDSHLSGHRLRAFFATQHAKRLWHDAYAQNGFRWEQAVENLVLDQVARALGHKQVSTTIRHYLELALMEYFGAAHKSTLKDLRKAAMVLKELPKTELEQATLVLNRLAQQGAKSDFAQALDALLAHPALQPATTMEAESPPPRNRQARPEFRLRVVPKKPQV